MILRRFMQHVKNQNWFAVGLDVLVVFGGLTAGFSLDRWQQSINTLEVEKQYLEKLTIETVELDNYLQSYRATHKGIVESIDSLLPKLEMNKFCTDLSDDGKAQLLAVTDFPPLNQSLITARELIQSGQLAIIGSDALRLQIGIIDDELGFINRQWHRYLQAKKHYEEAVFPAIGWSLSSGSVRHLEGGEDISKYQFHTIENLCGNRSLIAIISSVQFNHITYLQYLNRTLEKFGTYKKTLSDYRATLK